MKFDNVRYTPNVVSTYKVCELESLRRINNLNTCFEISPKLSKSSTISFFRNWNGPREKFSF